MKTLPPFNPNLDIDHNGNTNGVRADRSIKPLVDYIESCYSNSEAAKAKVGEFYEEHVADFISDLLHAAHRAGLDPDEIILRAVSMFEDESGCAP